MDIDVESNLVEEFCRIREEDVKFVHKCNELANGIRKGDFSILQLVEQLKTLLVDTVPENRQFGMVILHRILQLLPSDLLTGTQLNFICAFYSDRLNDHHYVIPNVLNGILTLLGFKNVPTGATKQILYSLFKHIPCQQQQQGDRYNIYKIIEICINTNLPELKEMGFDFIYGVISAMDGERDPRNLLYLFQWIPKFLKNFKLEHLSEEMFEVLACYFPVDFKAPSNDPNAISRETLANSLSYCLCAVPEFSEFCLPLVLEKLASSLKIAKLDSLSVLLQSCETFKYEAFLAHLTDIWHQICREVFTSNDSDIENLCFSLLTNVLHSVAQGTTEDVFQSKLSGLLDTIKPNLLPNGRLFVPSCKLLEHAAKSSNFSSNYIKSHFIPLLLNAYSMTTSSLEKVQVLKTLANLALICYSSDLNSQDMAIISKICIQTMLQQDEMLCATGLQGLGIICSLLEPDLRRNVLYKHFCMFMTTLQSGVVQDAFLSTFKIFSRNFPEEIRLGVLEKIEVKNVTELGKYLSSLGSIVDCDYFTETVLEIFIDFCTKDIEWAAASGYYLRRLLETHENDKKIQTVLVNRNTVGVLIDFIVHHLSIFDVSNDRHLALMKNISAVCKIIIGNESSESQFVIVNSKYQQINTLYQSNQNALYVVIFDALLSRLRRETKVKIEIAPILIAIALEAKEEFIRQVGRLLLANILNKLSDDQKLEEHLSEISIAYQKKGNTKNVIDLIFYISKALVMKDHPLAEIWTQRLFDLLETNHEAIYGFKIIMDDKCESLNDKCFCNKKLLYRQKFFTAASTKLKEKCLGENGNYLLAFGYMVQETPVQILALQFEKIMSLMILSLDKCNDTEVLCAILNTLNILIENKEHQMIEHASEFIHRLLTLSTFTSSMHVRITALHCLGHYATGYPLYKLLPYKQDVINGLKKSLDDRKRLVRKEAVETRLSWFMLDSPI